MTRLRLAAIVVTAAFAAACGSTGGTVLGPGDARPPHAAVSGFTELGASLAATAQPSDADLAAARAAGYRTVVNFRTPGEAGYVDERVAVEALGMRYVAIPIAGHAVAPEHADLLAAVLADGAAGPVLAHCKSGTRAKLAWTVWLARHGGRTPQDAAALGRRAGLSGEPLASAERALGLR